MMIDLGVPLSFGQRVLQVVFRVPSRSNRVVSSTKVKTWLMIKIPGLSRGGLGVRVSLLSLSSYITSLVARPTPSDLYPVCPVIDEVTSGTDVLSRD